MQRYFLAGILCMISATPLVAQDVPLSKILVENEGWREAAKGWPGVTFLEGETTGRIHIYQGPCKGFIKGNGVIEKTADSASSFDHAIVMTSTGVYAITQEKGKRSVTMVLPGESMLNLPGLRAPTCLTLWPDEGRLVIGEADGAYLWAVRIEKDGSFGPGDRYYSLQIRKGEKMHVAAMTMDAGYLLYACTPIGIQVFDPTGRLSGVVAAPSKDPMTAITVGGEKADTLFVSAGDKIFARRIQGKASYTLKKDQK